MKASTKSRTTVEQSAAVDARRQYSIDYADWRAMKIGEREVSGYSWIPLTDDEDGTWSSYWMRIEPGASSPMHEHDATEMIMVWQGMLRDDDGTDFFPGDVVVYAAGSRHKTSSTTGCTVLVISHKGARVVDP